MKTIIRQTIELNLNGDNFIKIFTEKNVSRTFKERKTNHRMISILSSNILTENHFEYMKLMKLMKKN